MKAIPLISALSLLAASLILSACDRDDSPTVEQDPTAEYTIERTLSDQAQLNTIAFDALAFFTNNLGDQSFLPPGKVADFSGFQYLRDNDPTGLGHNTDFVTIIAYNLLHRLSEDQIDQLVEAAQDQVDLINAYAYGRFPLMAAFRRQLEGDLPAGSQGLDLTAVREFSASLYLIDGRISIGRARLMGGILRSLSPVQQAGLDSLRSLEGIGNWDRTLSDPLAGRHLEHDVNVAVMTYASEMWSWFAGDAEADTYFCPERQGTYFGSFYLKDWPAMGNPDYTIDEQLTARAGENFLAVLTPAQRELVTRLVDDQRGELEGIVTTRREISEALRGYLDGAEVDTTEILDLCATYGELDGAIVHHYATCFAQIAQGMETSQWDALGQLADGLGYLPSNGAFLYSSPIPMPEVGDTDFLFQAASTGFSLTSPAFTQGGELPSEYTCDGAGISPPLAWDGLPDGTAGLALVMHHVAVDSTVHCYWILYDLPPTLTALAEGASGLGLPGLNTVNDQAGYAPPCSQGPGPKTYHLTLFALSEELAGVLTEGPPDREELLAALEGRTLSTAELEVVYERP